MENLNQVLANILSNLQTQKPDAVMADSPVTADNINKIVASIDELTKAVRAINNTNPTLPLAGYKYFRFPGDPVPWDKYPATLQEDWILLDGRYPGVTLRLSGGNASRFKDEGRSVIYDEATKGHGGAQMDAIQEHTHKSFMTRSEETRKGHYDWLASNSWWFVYDWGVHGARKDIETRMKNITIQIYSYKE